VLVSLLGIGIEVDYYITHWHWALVNVGVEPCIFSYLMSYFFIENV